MLFPFLYSTGTGASRCIAPKIFGIGIAGYSVGSDASILSLSFPIHVVEGLKSVCLQDLRLASAA